MSARSDANGRALSPQGGRAQVGPAVADHSPARGAGKRRAFVGRQVDGEFEDVFDLQDRITERVVGIVEPTVQKSEIERSRRKR
jgi:adenylate cyclase